MSPGPLTPEAPTLRSTAPSTICPVWKPLGCLTWGHKPVCTHRAPVQLYQAPGCPRLAAALTCVWTPLPRVKIGQLSGEKTTLLSVSLSCESSGARAGSTCLSWGWVTGSSPQAKPPDYLECPGYPYCVTALKQTNTPTPTACQALSYLSCHLI